jgi:hypothetical protein
MSETQAINKREIKFLFHPQDFEHQNHVIEKADSTGNKRRYLKGIASGSQVDGHGERITDRCIKSFMEQANSGDVLLYADRHGVAYTDDIGKLERSEISPVGDWACEFRLYDKYDNVGASTLEKADKLWKQILGLPPYKKPKQKGFSIEGYIPDEGILSMSTDGKRVIDQVLLDGVVCVPRPAYRTSVAQAIYKALDEIPPWNIDKEVENTFKKIIATEEIQNSYYRKRVQYQDALEDQIDKIMTSEAMADKEDILEKLFNEYAESMIELIMNSASIFDKSRTNSETESEDTSGEIYKSSKADRTTVIKSMISNLDSVIALLN